MVGVDKKNSFCHSSNPIFIGCNVSINASYPNHNVKTPNKRGPV